MRKGNVLVIKKDTVDEIWVERLSPLRCCYCMGAAAGIAMAPMKGSFVKDYAIPHTISRRLCLEDRSVINANKDNKDTH